MTTATAKPDDVAITITVDGVSSVFRPSEVSALHAGELRKATGMSLSGVLTAATADPDLDVLAALVWLARRQAGEAVTYAEVAGGITYGSKIETDDDAVDEENEGDSPEA